MESHPAALVKVAVYDPAPARLWAFHKYGSWLLQIVVLVVLATTGLTVKCSVAIESHPAALVSVAVYVPAPARLCAFHKYGSWLLQIVVLVVLVTTGLTV